MVHRFFHKNGTCSDLEVYDERDTRHVVQVLVPKPLVPGMADQFYDVRTYYRVKLKTEPEAPQQYGYHWHPKPWELRKVSAS